MARAKTQKTKRPAKKRWRIVVVHGPNLNLLGAREPKVYGKTTLADIDSELARRAHARGATIETFQSNVEGMIVDELHRAHALADAVIINPAAYTHTSVAIADAIKAVGLPTVEVHLSNIHAREEYRQKSLTAAGCIGTISGFGAQSYYLALDAVVEHLKANA